MRQWLERKLAPQEKPRQLRLRRDHLPRVFRGEAPGLYPQDESLKKFKPPSMFAEYKGLSALFLVILLGLACYFVHALWTAPPKPQPAPQSVYVEMVPASR
jgi:hypothetical protein